MTLFREGREVADEWTRVADGDPLPAGGSLLVGKTRWLSDGALRGRNASVGIILASGETLDGLEQDIARLSLIVLDIPRYADGRLYSIARLLRDRHGFAGEIRAAGDVLRDQIMLLHRVGVDSFDITHPGTIAAMRGGEIVAPMLHTQAAAREHEERRANGWPWRRVSPPRSVPGVKGA